MARYPDPYKKVRWRGVWMDNIDVVAFQVLEDHIGATATVFQGGYNPGGVAASAGAHDGGGAIDFWFNGPNIARVIRKARDIGWDAWYRYPPTFPTHVHAIRHQSRTAAPVAKGQMTDYAHGGNGLVPLGLADDQMTYRPSPLAVFTPEDYRRELYRRTLRTKLRHIGRDLKHLLRRKRAIRRKLRNH